MTVSEIAKKVSKTYQINENELFKRSLHDFLVTRKSEIERDIIDIFSRHGVSSMEQIQNLVKAQKGHPAWEDFITLENLHEKISEIKNDISALS